MDVSLAEACEEITLAVSKGDPSGEDGNEELSCSPRSPRLRTSVVRRALRFPKGVNRKPIKRLGKSGPFKVSPGGDKPASLKSEGITPSSAQKPDTASGQKKSELATPASFRSGSFRSLAPSYPFKSSARGKPEAYVLFVVTRFSGRQTVFPYAREIEEMQRSFLLFVYHELRDELRNGFTETVRKILPDYHGEFELSKGYERQIVRTLEFLDHLTRHKQAEFVVVPAVPVVYIHLLPILEE